MKVLFDTNIFYPCVNIQPNKQHQDSKKAARLCELIHKQGGQKYLSKEATTKDINQAKDPAVRTASKLSLQQWPTLDPTPPTKRFLTQAGYPTNPKPNDTVDAEILHAVHRNAADFLVTQDKKLRSRSSQAGLRDRVLSLEEAIDLFHKLAGDPIPYPTVQETKGYSLSPSDPIFNSIRGDYPDFGRWFKKVQSEHRPCLVLPEQPPSTNLNGVTILKHEDDNPHQLGANVLKLCTFKISEKVVRTKNGELLLKAAIQYARQHRRHTIYLEVYPSKPEVTGFFQRYGFVKLDSRTSRGELILVKHLTRDPKLLPAEPGEHNRLHGPGNVLVHNPHIIPIQPRWHNVLFPETTDQQNLFGAEPSGNAITKAYLSRSQITTLETGSTLLFYQSAAARSVEVIGVTERYEPFTDPNELIRFVGQRTVYSQTQIQDMCEQTQKGRERRSVLAILFRYDRVLDNPWAYDTLAYHNLLKGPPQSIQKVNGNEQLTWIKNQLQ